MGNHQISTSSNSGDGHFATTLTSSSLLSWCSTKLHSIPRLRVKMVMWRSWRSLINNSTRQAKYHEISGSVWVHGGNNFINTNASDENNCHCLPLWPICQLNTHKILYNHLSSQTHGTHETLERRWLFKTIDFLKLGSPKLVFFLISKNDLIWNFLGCSRDFQTDLFFAPRFDIPWLIKKVGHAAAHWPFANGTTMV